MNSGLKILNPESADNEFLIGDIPNLGSAPRSGGDCYFKDPPIRGARPIQTCCYRRFWHHRAQWLNSQTLLLSMLVASNHLSCMLHIASARVGLLHVNKLSVRQCEL